MTSAELTPVQTLDMIHFGVQAILEECARQSCTLDESKLLIEQPLVGAFVTYTIGSLIRIAVLTSHGLSQPIPPAIQQFCDLNGWTEDVLIGDLMRASTAVQ
jgi:hypothetical protein